MTEVSNLPADSDSTNYWLGATLFVVVLAAYWPSMKGQFLWDDNYYVTHNRALEHWDGIEKIWTGIKDPQTYPVPQFYPMTVTSFWAQARLHNFDEPLTSEPFHLVNVLLHAVSAWMLWTILRRLKIPGAFVAAAIWALHPVQVESVAWITERKNVLSAFFCFASMLVYLRYCGMDETEQQEPRSAIALPQERGKLYALALVFFACSILSKSVTGSMPAVILLLIWWKRGTIKWADVWPLIPYFVLAIAMGYCTHYFERNVVGAQGREWDSIGIPHRFLIAGGAVWFYLFKLFWPANLAFIYPRWDLHSPILVVAVVAAAGALAALFAARRRIGRGPIVIALLFVGSLFPALGFINYFPMRYSFVADHFQYLACSAVIVGVAWCLHRFFSTATRFAVASGLILGALTAITWSQNHVYVSLENLWTDTVNKNPDAWVARNNLGAVYLDQGRLDEAETQFRRVLEIKPDHVEAVMNLGLVAEKRGHLDEAIGDLLLAAHQAQADPEHAAAHANVQYNLGRLYEAKGDRNGAAFAYQAAAQADRHNAAAIAAMGRLLLERGDRESAKAWLIKAIDLDVHQLSAHANLGRIYLEEGNPEGAMNEWRYVMQEDPRNVPVLIDEGVMALQINQPDAAVSLFKKALEIDPNSVLAQRNLADALRMQQAATRPATTQSATQSGATQP